MAIKYNGGRYLLFGKDLDDGFPTPSVGALVNGEGEWKGSKIFVDKDQVYRPHPDGPNGLPELLGTITDGVALSRSGQFMFELRKDPG